MEFRDLILKRRSYRMFTGGGMTKAQLDYILSAATRAPNACNLQSWHFTAVCGRENIEKLYPKIYGGAWIKNAAVVIIVSTDSEGVEKRFGERGRDLFAIQDTACAMNNILLAAADMGFGGCFIGAFDEAACREAFGLGERYRPVAIAAIGAVEVEVPLRDRKPIQKVVDIIGELPGEDEEDESESGENKPFELRSMYLPGAVFDDLYLGNAVFNNICFTGASFSDINFTGSSFGGLCMNETLFGCIDMNGASFKNCTLKDVTIENCDIDGLTINGKVVKEILDK